MSDALRRLYNSVDRLFDRGAIEQELKRSRPAGGLTRPATAAAALESVRREARAFDRGARLKMIVSQTGLDRDGASSHWEFFFDLPARRAQLVCEWILDPDKTEPAQLELTVRPFPPANSPLRQMARAGKLLHQQLAGMWRQELRRRPDLPARFRDTRAVADELLRQGLDIDQTEFSLATGRSANGRLAWIAETRRKSYSMSLE